MTKIWMRSLHIAVIFISWRVHRIVRLSKKMEIKRRKKKKVKLTGKVENREKSLG